MPETTEAARPFSDIPQPEGTLIKGNLDDFARDMMDAFMTATRDHGDIVRFRFLHQKGLLLTHPDHIKHVLIQNHRNYVKQTRGYKAMRALLGNGLVTSEGDFWLRQRRIAQPSFHKNASRDLATLWCLWLRRWPSPGMSTPTATPPSISPLR